MAVDSLPPGGGALTPQSAASYRRRLPTARAIGKGTAEMGDESRFQAALSKAPVVLFAQDRDLRYTWIHDPAGSAPQETVGRTDEEIFPPPAAATLTAIKARVQRSGQGSRQEVRLELPAGVRHYDLTVEPLLDADGSPAGITGAALDVTERVAAEGGLAETTRQLEAAHATFRHLVQNSPFGVYAVDADFRLVQVSAGAQKVFATVRPLLGRDFAEVLRILWPEPFVSEAIALFRHTLATGEPYRAPSLVERRSDIGEVESYDWKIERVVLPDGRPGVVCHFYDLSERQRFEAELQERDRRKDEFLGMLAHELRNPLSAISNAVQLQQRLGPPDPALRWSRNVIERQVAHLTRMVDDLLDVSRVTQGQLTIRTEVMPLAVPISLAVDIAHAQFESRKQELAVDLAEPIAVACDSARLAQAVANLLHNASKFTPEGGHIALSVARRGDRAVVSVRDDGRGMAPELLAHVFEVFVQGEQSLDRRLGGLGLGLPISKRIVELQGGTLVARSDGPGRGSEFVLELPAVDAPLEETAPAVLAYDAAKRRILLVDDNADALEALQVILQLMGHEVEAATDGESALAVAARFRPELVALDIGLPGIDGYEVARRLRALPGLAGAVLVALTGYGQDEDRERARAAGFDHHLLKPVLPEAVVALAGPRPSPPPKEGAGTVPRRAGSGG
jgi:signal transduction histidine kinase/CheY-like chemotaxis protein